MIIMAMLHLASLSLVLLQIIAIWYSFSKQNGMHGIEYAYKHVFTEHLSDKRRKKATQDILYKNPLYFVKTGANWTESSLTGRRIDYSFII